MIYEFAQQTGFGVCGLSFSPIKGPEGNIEYLIYLKKGTKTIVDAEQPEQIVALSHETLDQKES